MKFYKLKFLIVADLVSDLWVKNRIQEKAMIVINIHCDDLTREN